MDRKCTNLFSNYLKVKKNHEIAANEDVAFHTCIFLEKSLASAFMSEWQNLHPLERMGFRKENRQENKNCFSYQ